MFTCLYDVVGYALLGSLSFMCLFPFFMVRSVSSHACMLGFTFFHAFMLAFTCLDVHLHAYMHISLPIRLDLCSHMLICFDSHSSMIMC